MKRKIIAALVCLLMALMLVPQSAFAAQVTSVDIFSGAQKITLDADTPYFDSTDDTAKASGALGENGCTAYFHDGILELKGFDVTGAGDVGFSSIYSAIFADGDLEITLDGDNSISMPSRDAEAAAYARALYAKGGALTIGGSGRLSVTTGSGYNSNISCAVSCLKLTVSEGVTLLASVGASKNAGPDNANYGIRADQFINHGVVEANGENAGVFCSAGITEYTSSNYGTMTASGTGFGMMTSSKATFVFASGTAVIAGGSGYPAIGASNVGIVDIAIDPSIKSGSMGENEANAATFTSEEIVGHYTGGSRSYSYLRLPDPPADPPANPKTGYGVGDIFMIVTVIIMALLATIMSKSVLAKRSNKLKTTVK